MKTRVWLVAVALLVLGGDLSGQEPARAASEARLVVLNRELHKIDSRLFGHFMERPSWDGEIGIEAAVIQGTNHLQPKVVKLLQGLNPPIIRFPHGTDGDYTDWTDMIDNVPGRKPLLEQRPVTIGHTGNKVSNRFGFDEFLRLCEELKAEPLLVVNFRDGLLDKKPLAEAAAHAAALVAYCNAGRGAKLPPGLKQWPEVRAKNGRPEPYKVRYIQIGNETAFFFPELQKNHPHPKDYFDKYLACLKEYVRAVKAVDPSIQILTDSHNPDWDVAFRKEFGDEISYLVEHFYSPLKITEFKKSGRVEPVKGLSQRDLWNAYVTAGPVDPDTGLSVMPLRSVAAAKKHRYPIAVTEWNLNGWFRMPAPPDYSELARGVGAAGMLHGLMRAGHDVKIACQSMTVGQEWGITAIRVDPSAKVDPYYLPSGQVVALYNKHHGNALMETATRGIPTFEQPLQYGTTQPSPKVAALDALATSGREKLVLHLINRDFERAIDLDVDASAFGDLTGAGTRFTLAGRLRNQAKPGESRQVAEIEQSEIRMQEGRIRVHLAPRTVSCVELYRQP